MAPDISTLLTYLLTKKNRIKPNTKAEKRQGANSSYGDERQMLYRDKIKTVNE